ncbi:uncharacterized protein G2W53_041977 [Senna tora]|uniref:Uncharacterized protein n=1 Tax=Senna tora TaxID=362788 RepID=A0A834W1X9_9FABA|nr:uncharacterized protein G2W53_041977 [Senna tora]
MRSRQSGSLVLCEYLSSCTCLSRISVVISYPLRSTHLSCFCRLGGGGGGVANEALVVMQIPYSMTLYRMTIIHAKVLENLLIMLPLRQNLRMGYVIIEKHILAWVIATSWKLTW